MAKAPDAFRTISEVAELLDTPAHVLRFWESKFAQVKPVKRAGGRRYYRPDDVALLGGIKTLLHDQGMTIKGAQKVLRDRGVKAVTEMGRPPEHQREDDVIDAVALAPAPAPRPVVATDGAGAAQTPDDTSPVDADDTVSADHDDAPPRIDVPDEGTDDRAATPDATPDSLDGPVAEDAPVAAPPRRVAITDITFVDDDTPQDRTHDRAQAGNVVPMPQQAPLPEPQDDGQTAAPAMPTPDLPDLPRPRPITGSRLLGTLARMDRASVAAHGGALAPLVDRLTQAHARLTGR